MRRYWNPMREMMQLHARLGRALGDPPVRQWRPEPRRQESTMPPLDVGETAEAFVVSIDLPGMKKDEIAATVDGNLLEISGTVNNAPPAAYGPRTLRVWRAGRFRGPFRRVVPLPSQADPDAVTASLVDGVLTVSVGKR